MHPSVCGFHEDCVEGLASGSALVSRLDGRRVRDVAADDPVWEPVIAYIAAMAHAIVCGAGPQRIAIGGGVVTAQPHLLARIEAALSKSLNGYMQLPPIDGYVTPPALGDMAGPMGSIALATAACAAVA
jgi:fructokinase